MAWLPGYAYRKPLVLTGGASGAQTDFQLNIDIAHVAAKMQADFDDIRFTQADGTTLIDAWLESKVDSTSAKTWAEFPTTPANTVEQTYYMYYGKAVANYWDIGATMLFGDDFPGSALDTTNKWTIKNGSCSVSNGYAQLYGLPNFVITKNYTATNVVLHTKFILNSTQAAGIVFRSTDEVRNIADFYIAYLRADNTLKLSKMVNDARTDFNSKAYTQGAATYEEHITYNGTALDVNIWKGAASDSLAATGDGTRSDGRIGFVNYANISEGDFKIDYIFTIKYAANPPTYAFGSEESEAIELSAIIATVTAVSASNLNILRPLTSTIATVTLLSEIELLTGEIRELVATIAASTSTSTSDLNILRELIASIDTTTSLSDIELLAGILRELSATIAVATSASVSDLNVVRGMDATISSTTSMSDADLNVLRELASTIASVTLTSTIDLLVETLRVLSATIATTTSTSTPDMKVLRELEAIIEATTALTTIELMITMWLTSNPTITRLKSEGWFE